MEVRDREIITSHFLAGSFGRQLRCSLLTDPLARYARRSRLANGQNSCAIKRFVVVLSDTEIQRRISAHNSIGTYCGLVSSRGSSRGRIAGLIEQRSWRINIHLMFVRHGLAIQNELQTLFTGKLPMNTSSGRPLETRPNRHNPGRRSMGQ